MRRTPALIAALALAVPANAAAAAPPVVGGSSFNQAPRLSPGSFADAVQTGGAVFYRLHVPSGVAPKATVRVDVSGLDQSTTGASSLDVKLYDPLRRQVAEVQDLGPGDPTTHVKSTTAAAPAVARAGGDYYVSARMNDFLPTGSAPAELPLGVDLTLGKRPRAAQQRAATTAGVSGTSWAVFAALCAAGLVLGGLGGVLLRRR